MGISRLPLLHLSLALALSGCGGGSSPSSTTVVDESAMARLERGSSGGPACTFSVADVERAPLVGLAGMRLRARIPDGFVSTIGVPWLAHACGVLITFAETPPMPSETDREAFTTGVLRGMQGIQARAGVQCTDEGGGAYRCVGPETTALQLVRTGGEGGVIGVIHVQGALPLEVAEAIARSATGDPAAPWDPLRAMSLSIAPIQDLPMTALSTPPVLRFDLPTAPPPGSTTPRLLWVFVPYGSHPSHPDGSAWSEDEIGVVVGERSARELELTTFGEGRDSTGGIVRTTELGDDAEIVAGGTTASGPVTVYAAYLREPLGVYLVFGRMPVSQEGIWLPRFQSQVRSYRVVR